MSIRPSTSRTDILLFSLCLCLLPASCGETSPAPVHPGAPPDILVYHVMDTLQHDPQAFTQGLEVHDGLLYESTGLFGSSSLRVLSLADGSLLSAAPLPDTLFGEGITFIDDTILQLTWQSGMVLRWTTEPLVYEPFANITSTGWGICALNDSTVATSDGSPLISIRRSYDMTVVGTVWVTMNGVPQYSLNELEYHSGRIYANKWGTDLILRIDPFTGLVDGAADLGGLLSAAERESADVLNGIAWDSGRNAFVVTGKNWPRMFAVTLSELTR